jgi:6,7-dimethyl-8-ribityllumazine synthase
MAARVARAGDVDGIIALACLIRGGTEHYRLLADESTRALGVLAMEGATNPKALAVSFCVLACDTLSQAQERADPGQGDRGGEAALACIEQARALAAVG